MNTKGNSSIGYKGIWPVLVTPYNRFLKIDVSAYRYIINWQIEMGCHGIYALCLSSEMYLLSQQERLLLVREAVEVADGRVPIAVTGNLDEDFPSQIEFAHRAHDLGADVVMLIIPSFCKTAEEQRSYFLDFAEQTPFALGLYECPYPEHRTLSISLIEELSLTGRFVAFKETSCSIEKIADICRVIEGSELSLLQANIPYLVEALQKGAQGSMNVVANWLPDLVTDIYQHFRSSDAKEKHQLLCSMELAQRTVHPAGVKYLMAKRGLPILPHTRYKKQLSAEERQGLDCASKYWFSEDFTIRSEIINKAVLD